MSKIDYSKWDKMSFSDDESSDSDADHTPAVTKLDAPSKVTISSKGVTVLEPSSIKTSPLKTMKSKSIELKENSVVKQPITSSKETTETGDTLMNETTTMELSRIKYLSKNGGIFADSKDPYCKTYWSQDRNEAILSVLYDSSAIKSSDIRVEVTGALKYSDRHSAVSMGQASSHGKIKIYDTTRNVTLLQGDFAYPIHLTEGEEEVDWEIDVTDAQNKLIRVTLLKAVPMYGVTLWWSRPLTKFNEIDISTGIEGRNYEGSRQQEWKSSWDEAHRLFKEQVKSRERHVIEDN
jgi:hypothetical protein